MPYYNNNKVLGIDLRLPGHTKDKLRGKNSPDSSCKNSPTSSVTELRQSSMDHIKRPSLPGLSKKHDSRERKDKKDRSLSKDKHAKEPKSPTQQHAPVKLGMAMESPPVLLIGSMTQSTGALMSGRLQVTPNIPEATLDSIALYLECTTATKRPVQDRCRECMWKVNDLFEWKFLTKPKTFKASEGMQEMPFSHMVPGHLPATTHGQIGSVDYSLHVVATSRDGQKTEFRRELVIRRALVPGSDKNSVRVFPPTNLSLHVTLPNIVHPIGEFPVQCRLTGITTKRDDTQTRWRLRKLTWHIEEHEQMISPACTKHAGKVGGEGKGVQHEHSRDVGLEELKSGWKTDFDDGKIEGEFNAAINPATKPQCSMEAQNGLKITHNLVLELVIAEEWSPNKKPHQGTPTGAARVLRTQFALNVVERAGMGLSWDDEMPPMYEDVPDSPPHYQNLHTTITNYEGDDLHEDVEHLTLNP